VNTADPCTKPGVSDACAQDGVVATVAVAGPTPYPQNRENRHRDDADPGRPTDSVGVTLAAITRRAAQKYQTKMLGNVAIGMQFEVRIFRWPHQEHGEHRCKRRNNEPRRATALLASRRAGQQDTGERRTRHEYGVQDVM
jgi:hypothetical protein